MRRTSVFVLALFGSGIAGAQALYQPQFGDQRIEDLRAAEESARYRNPDVSKYMPVDLERNGGEAVRLPEQTLDSVGLRASGNIVDPPEQAPDQPAAKADPAKKPRR